MNQEQDEKILTRMESYERSLRSIHGILFVIVILLIIFCINTCP